jgi:hypothetical protein
MGFSTNPSDTTQHNLRTTITLNALTTINVFVLLLAPNATDPLFITSVRPSVVEPTQHVV